MRGLWTDEAGHYPNASAIHIPGKCQRNSRKRSLRNPKAPPMKSAPEGVLFVPAVVNYRLPQHKQSAQQAPAYRVIARSPARATWQSPVQSISLCAPINMVCPQYSMLIPTLAYRNALLEIATSLRSSQ